MNLAEFIRRNLAAILQDWESFARTLLPAAASMSAIALRDHARQILLAIAADMETKQSAEEQKSKSLGDDESAAEAHEDSAATTHGGLRQEGGFDLVQLVAEYRALRASVLRLWTGAGLASSPRDFDDMVRFNEAIDQAIAESVARYSEEIAKARDTFIAILGHDLRSPLGAIVMSAHALASFELPEKAAKASATIQRSAHAMHSMIRDLLDFAGDRLGREMTMRFLDADLLDTCRSALSEVKAAHPQRTFRLDHDGDLRARFDPERIAQALSNLLNNAVNHGHANKPVDVSVRREAGEVVVDVINEGPTIPPDVLQGILDPASRARETGSEGSSGLSLGLYIAQQVAKAHGGRVTAASHDGEVRFSLRLPASGVDPAVA